MGLFGSKKNKTQVSNEPATEVTLSDGKTYVVKKVVNCIGDSCPRPQLMTKKAIKNSAVGDLIEVQIDNPTSMESIPPMLPELNASHLETIKAERYWRVFVRVN